MKTKAAVVYERSGKFTMDQIEISEPNDDEALVRVVATGICHTDLAGREQYLPIPPARAFPAVFGHEGAGVVERVGARVSKVKPGDHVALSWNSCGACASCKSGNEPYCDNLFLYNFNGARPDGTTTLRKGISLSAPLRGGRKSWLPRWVHRDALCRRRWPSERA